MSRLPDDIEGRTENEYGLYGSGHILDFAITKAMLVIGWLARFPDREPGNYGSNQVNPRMYSFGNNADLLHHDTDDHLQDDQYRIRNY